jgi:hypothetical protein
LVRRNKAGSQFVEEIKANFDDVCFHCLLSCHCLTLEVTKKFETKYLELQRENRALEEACTSLAHQLEALSMDAPSSASINAHASQKGARQAVDLPNTALEEEIASLQSMFSSVTTQLSQGLFVCSFVCLFLLKCRNEYCFTKRIQHSPAGKGARKGN